jgi:hypothetical protein
MSIRIATMSAFAFFAIVGVSGGSAVPINTATSIAPATAASSLVTYADYVLVDGRCYVTGHKFSHPVDMSKCKAQHRAPAR